MNHYINKGINHTYVEGELITRGGFCNIYECSHFDEHGSLVNQHLVLKRLIREDGLGTDPHRFTREIRYFDDLNHPNILKPYYFDDYEGIIVMERYPLNLADFIDTVTYDTLTCFEIFKQILDAVEYYTGEGYLHRDLKPQNILISSSNIIKITDFGLSARMNRNETNYNLTKSNTNAGTDNYSAPEQLLDLNKADIRSEIFSLGKIFYSLYARDNFQIEMTNLSTLPSDIRFFIQKATLYNADKRFQSLDEFKEAYLLLKENPNSSDTSLLELEDALTTITKLLETDNDFYKTSTIYNMTNSSSFGHTAELFIDLPTNEHQAIKILDSISYNEFIVLSCDLIERKGFSFSYVDSIVSKIITLLNVFKEELDIEFQTKLINAAITVSSNHNRFIAMKNIGQYIADLRNSILIFELKKITDNKNITKIRNYFDSTNLKSLLNE